MYVKVGDPIRARDTKLIRDCGIAPGAAGRIEGVNGAQISFFLEKSAPKQHYTHGHMSLGTFNENFVVDKSKESARRSQTTANAYPAAFPKDWEKPSGRPSLR